MKVSTKVEKSHWGDFLNTTGSPFAENTYALSFFCFLISSKLAWDILIDFVN